MLNIIKDMCAECGADLRKLDSEAGSAGSVAMVHAIPELKVSDTEAKNIGHEDQTRLLEGRKVNIDGVVTTETQHLTLSIVSWCCWWTWTRPSSTRQMTRSPPT